MARGYIAANSLLASSRCVCMMEMLAVVGVVDMFIIKACIYLACLLFAVVSKREMCVKWLYLVTF